MGISISFLHEMFAKGFVDETFDTIKLYALVIRSKNCKFFRSEVSPFQPTYKPTPMPYRILFSILFKVFVYLLNFLVENQ